MDHNSFSFKPRGIIKWHPFNAVDDMISVQYELDRINNIKPQPDLSDDQLDDLQRDLDISISKKHIITIHYYTNCAIESITGIVRKIDYIDKYVFVNDSKISIELICYILTEQGVDDDAF